MPFAALSDGFHDSPKVLAAGNAATGAFARALSYCVDQLTDGYVPAVWAKSNANAKEIKALTIAGFWTPVSGGEVIHVDTRQGEKATVTIPGPGFFIKDYCEFNDTKAFVKKRSEEKREAGRKGAKARWADSNSHSNSHSSSEAGGTPDRMTDGMPPVPVPTPPNNEPQEEAVLDPVVEGSEDEGSQARIAALAEMAAGIGGEWSQPDLPQAADDDIPF